MKLNQVCKVFLFFIGVHISIGAQAQTSDYEALFPQSYNQDFAYNPQRDPQPPQPSGYFDLNNWLMLYKLVQQFAPVVFLHPRERFFPCDIEFYLSYCDLYEGDPKGRASKVADWMNGDPELLGEYREENRFFLKPRLKGTQLQQFYQGLPPNRQKGYVDAPMYVNVVFNEDQSHVILQVWFFYAFNGPTIEPNVLGPRRGRTKGIGAHQSDWEHVDIHLRIKPGMSENSPLHEAYYIERIFYAAHSATVFGKYKTGREIEFRQVPIRGDIRPVVYSSLNSHASKYNPRLKDTQLDTADYNFELGRTWIPDNIVIVSVNGRISSGQNWINYGGLWGGDGNKIMNPKIQNYWIHTYGQMTQVTPTDKRSKQSIEVSVNSQTGKSNAFTLKNKIPTRIEQLCFLMDTGQLKLPYVVMGKRTFGRDQQIFGPFMSGQTRCQSRLIRGKESLRGNKKFIDQQFNQLYIRIPKESIRKRPLTGAYKVRIWTRD